MMTYERNRKIVVAGLMGAISVFLGATRLGYIPGPSGIALTIMHIPVIIAAVLEGPVVGLVVGAIFGISSLIIAAVAPIGPSDPWFVNPLLSVLPRLFIGPVAAGVWMLAKRWPIPGLLLAGIAGSLTNTVLVLGMIVVLGYIPVTKETLALVFLNPINLIGWGLEAAAAAVLTLVVVAAWQRIVIGGRRGANL